MINIIEELIDIENQAHKIFKESDKGDKIREELLDILKKEISEKIIYFTEKEIDSCEKRNFFERKKRLHEIMFRLDNFMLYMEKKFEREKDNWLEKYLKKIIMED